MTGPEITVAAAANLADAFEEIGRTFTRQTGVRVVYSYGATTQLARQIANAAPFDVFASADTEHVDQLVQSGRLLPQSRAVYARGQLALWIPNGEALHIRGLPDLLTPKVRFIAVATPSFAPYGKATVESLRALGVWDALQPKVVYAASIIMARQLAASGNVEAAFTAYSLVLHETGVITPVDGELHAPLDQALGIVAGSKNMANAQRFAGFVTSGEGKAILARYGYSFRDTPRDGTSAGAAR